LVLTTDNFATKQNHTKLNFVSAICKIGNPIMLYVLLKKKMEKWQKCIFNNTNKSELVQLFMSQKQS